jgi:nicotinate-nucleotide pyrophosphorylase (carboxylating)
MKALRSAAHTMRIEVEVTNLDEVDEAVEGKADIVLLDNMTPDDVRSAVERIAGRALVEASGGVTLENVRAYAEAGVDYISVGRLTHAAPALDLSLEVTAV